MIERYLRSVRAELECPEQERLVGRLRDAVSAYLEENPEATEEDIVLMFGTPAACAAHLLEEFDPARLSAVRKAKRRRTRWILGVLAALLVLALCAVGYLWSTGGLVIIEHTRYADGFPDDVPMGEVRYDYEN